MAQKKFLRLDGIDNCFVDVAEIAAIQEVDNAVKTQCSDALTALGVLFDGNFPPEIQPLVCMLENFASLRTTVFTKGGTAITSRLSANQILASIKQFADPMVIMSSWDKEFDPETSRITPEGADLVVDLLAVAGVGAFNNPNMEGVDQWVAFLREEIGEMTTDDIDVLDELTAYASSIHNETVIPIQPEIIGVWLDEYARTIEDSFTGILCPNCDAKELVLEGSRRVCTNCGYDEDA